MSRSRRDFFVRALCGSAALGLRSMLSGIPVAWLLDPRTALAQAAATCTIEDPQFLVLSASDKGDPINANAPGCYDEPSIQHSSDPQLSVAEVQLGSRTYQGAKPWADLPAAVRARAAFFHHATGAVAHPNHPDVMALLGQSRANEMAPSIYAKALAGCLGTVQVEPVSVGAEDAGELLRFEGRALSALSPRALKTVLGASTGPLASLSALQRARDSDLDRLNALFKDQGNNAQRAFLDRLARSQTEAREIPIALLDTLSAIDANDVSGQILAASALIRMKISPVVTIHIPFGGDNHADPEFAIETEQTVSGVLSIGELASELTSAGLFDQTTFALLNVFGRTLVSSGRKGRNHNPHHAVSLLIGKHVRAGVIGGLIRSGDDVAAQAIDSASGAGQAGGDIAADASLASLGKTLGAVLGLPDALLDQEILAGRVVRGAVV